MASSPPVRRAAVRDERPARRVAASPRASLVLAGPSDRVVAWWLDPIRAVLFIVMPIFCFASYLNQFTYWTYGASEDFVTARTFGLAIYSSALMLSGVVLARLAIRRRDVVLVLDEARTELVLRWLGWISIAAYIFFLGALLAHPGLVLALFQGSIQA